MFDYAKIEKIYKGAFFTTIYIKQLQQILRFVVE